MRQLQCGNQKHPKTVGSQIKKQTTKDQQNARKAKKWGAGGGGVKIDGRSFVFWLLNMKKRCGTIFYHKQPHCYIAVP